MKTLHLMSNTIIWFMDTTGKHGEFKNQIIQAQVIHRPGDTVQYRLPKRLRMFQRGIPEFSAL